MSPKNHNLARYLASLIFCVGCQSSGPREPASPQGKATPKNEATPKNGEPDQSRVELGATVICAARSPGQIQSAILLNPEIQACLRAELRNHPAKFRIAFSGQLTGAGSVENFQSDTPSDALKDCFEHEFAQLKLGAGGAGPFEMRIGFPPSFTTRPKTFVIDLNETKRLQ